MGSATCLRNSPGDEQPGCKNRDEGYYREQMEILKNYSCSEFVNFLGKYAPWNVQFKKGTLPRAGHTPFNV
ncbi:MAG TPA: hypothetical protein VFK47_00745, partial [Ktedonobacteraceae bacterium]|nr:hypothetical protein [Ktedonobacteraceae bacterium]